MDFTRGLQGLLNLSAFDKQEQEPHGSERTRDFADESARTFYVQAVESETSIGLKASSNNDRGRSSESVDEAIMRLLSFVVSMEEKLTGGEQVCLL